MNTPGGDSSTPLFLCVSTSKFQVSKPHRRIKNSHRYGMREASKRVGPWRDAVRTEALAACGELIEEACSVTVEFRFLRPKGDFGAKGNLRCHQLAGTTPPSETTLINAAAA